jgi:hypothetical protein
MTGSIEKLLPDGLYLHLPEEIYFRQGRLGSSDWAKLYLKKEGFWWSSEMNPDYVDPNDATALNYGHGLHAALLEGDDAFEERFAVAPERSDYEGLCDTVDEIREAIAKAGFTPAPKSKAKEEHLAAAREVIPRVPLWADIMAAFEKSIAKTDDRPALTPLSRADHRSIQVMTRVVREHPELGELFRYTDAHLPLAEVSVLYTDGWGIRRRARLDLMIPTVTVDLKTLANFSGKSLNFAVGERVVSNGYHVQMADHHEARHRAYRFIVEGKIHGATPAERLWLQRFPTDAQKWDYVWMFYQKPDSKKGDAPVVFPWWSDYAGDLHRRGLRCQREAMDTYRRCMAEFGPDKPWTRVEPVHMIEAEAGRGVPKVWLPNWIGGSDPLPDEDEVLFP